MATDWAFYYLTRPTGLAVIALVVALAVAAWRVSLGAAAVLRVGYAPLLAGFVAATVGLLALTFASSYFEFSDRVAKGVLQESERWRTVSRWSIYLAVLSLVAVLPLLSFLATPLAGVLIRSGRLSVVSICLATGLTALACAMLVWASPFNQWSTAHRLESLLSLLARVGLGVCVVGLPFLLAIHGVIRVRVSAET